MGTTDAQFWCAVSCILFFCNAVLVVLAMMFRSECLRLRDINTKTLELNLSIVSAMANVKTVEDLTEVDLDEGEEL